jgi:hypothetical protein
MGEAAWFAMMGDRQIGPVSPEVFLQHIGRGEIRRETMVWREGMSQWQPAGTIAELFAQPPPLPDQPAIPLAAIHGGPVPLAPLAPVIDLGQSASMRMLVPVGRSGWAIAAGYLGLFSVMVLPGPIALACGIYAIRDIRANPTKHGMGRAIFGVVMGGLASVVLVIAVVSLAIGH